MLSSRRILPLYGLVIATLLSACGGSTPTQPTSSSSSQTSSSNNTFLDSGTSLSYASSVADNAKLNSEFVRVNGTGASSNQSPYEAINAHHAYGYGVSGNGKTIAIVDSRYDNNHLEISNKAESPITFGSLAAASAGDDHGLAVSSIAAGAKDGNGIHGVAYAAKLHLSDYTYFGGETYIPDRWAQLTNDAASHNAVVQNNSWGINTTLTDVKNLIQSNNWSNAQGVADEFHRNRYDANASSVNNYVQALDDFQAKGVIVYALSNSHGFAEADFQAALPELFPQLAEAWITTTNVDITGSSGSLSYTRKSAPCGSTAAYCLGADGWQIVSAKSDASSNAELADSVNGTSFAAPQISGAIALLAEAFPNHTPAQLVDRLLASANNDFFSATAYTTFENGVQHGYNSEFGHGIADLDAAMKPILNTGSPRLVTGASLQSAGQYSLSNSRLLISASFGDSVARALSNHQVYVYDALNGGFSYSLDKAIGPSLKSTKQQLALHLDKARKPTNSKAIKAIATPYNDRGSRHLEHTFGSATLHASFHAHGASQLPPRLSLVWQSAPYKRTQTLVEAGIHRAPESLLGLQGKGALNLRGASGVSSFSNLYLRHKLSPNWQVDAQASLATSQLNTPQDSLIQGFQNVTSNAFRLAVTGQKLFTQDQLSVQINQPHRVNSGSLLINVADLADAHGNLTQHRQTLAIGSSGRQLDLQLRYQLWLGQNLHLGWQHQTSIQPNHVADAATHHQQTVSLQSDVFAAALGYDINKQQPSVMLRWQGDL